MAKKILPLTFALALTVLPLAEASGIVGNKNSLKFHYTSCQWARKMKDTNRIYFTARQDALKAGYVPCKVCNP